MFIFFYPEPDILNMRYSFYIFLLLIPGYLFGQDIHFSNTQANLQFINPSMSANPGTDNRIGIQYRNQGRSISSPYQTYGCWMEKTIHPRFLKNDMAGYSIIATHDNAGDGDLQQTRIMVGGSYAKNLYEGKLFVALGYALGITNRSVNYSALLFPSQWNGHSFDPGLPQQEAYKNSSFFYTDMSAGISVHALLSESISLLAGVSLDHLTEPKETFYAGENRLGRKINLHGSIHISSGRTQYTPGVIYTNQSGSYELLMGSNFSTTAGGIELKYGIWYRWNRDLIPIIGIEANRYELTMAYDINVGTMHQATLYMGGIEISLAIHLSNHKTDKYDCEQMEFE